MNSHGFCPSVKTVSVCWFIHIKRPSKLQKMILLILLDQPPSGMVICFIHSLDVIQKTIGFCFGSNLRMPLSCYEISEAENACCCSRNATGSFPVQIEIYILIQRILLEHWDWCSWRSCTFQFIFRNLYNSFGKLLHW